MMVVEVVEEWGGGMQERNRDALKNMEKF